MGGPDLCRAIKAERKGENCLIDKNNDIFKHCKAIGGQEKDGKCVIGEERLRQLLDQG